MKYFATVQLKDHLPVNTLIPKLSESIAAKLATPSFFALKLNFIQAVVGLLSMRQPLLML
jgi:hypothetical protein